MTKASEIEARLGEAGYPVKRVSKRRWRLRVRLVFWHGLAIIPCPVARPSLSRFLGGLAPIALHAIT